MSFEWTVGKVAVTSELDVTIVISHKLLFECADTVSKIYEETGAMRAQNPVPSVWIGDVCSVTLLKRDWRQEV